MNNSTFIRQWFEEPKKRLGRYGYGRSYCNLEMDSQMLYSFGRHFPLVVQSFEGVYILNGDRYSSTTTGHQWSVRSAVPEGCNQIIIPFSALREMFDSFREGSMNMMQTGLEARKIKFVDRRGDEYREIPYVDENGEEKTRTEHLLGAVLFRYNRRYFLSGTDPSAKWGFGYFLSQLRGRPKSVDEAFDMLMPIEVRETESEWKRQGEWFFICEGKAYAFRSQLKERALEMSEEQLKHEMRQYRLNGKLQPITFSIKPFIVKGMVLPPVGMQITGHHKVTEVVQTPDDVFHCRGTVRHTRGEHTLLKLGSTWWRAVPNTQVTAWGAGVAGARGRVD